MTSKLGSNLKFIAIAISGALIMCFLCVISTLTLKAISPAKTIPTVGAQSLRLTSTLLPTRKPTQTRTSLLHPTETATTAPTQNARCVPASQAQIDIIRSGIKGIDQNNDIGTAYAVKSNDFKNVWFVAAIITGVGLQPDTAGVWAIPGELDKPDAGAYSVDGFSLRFSDWADGPKSKMQLSLADDGAQESLDCAKNQ